jgi:8-oxo-dGTP pyrophosphatase MutT (NUDIX family)
MNAYIAAVRHRHRGPVEVLLGQRNIYLPPHGRFQFAAISRNAVQYVLPGGKVEPGDSLERTALREFHETTGVELSVGALTPFYTDSEDAFFRVDYEHAHGHHDVEHINLAIAEGRTPSLAFNHFAWFGIESAQCALGNKPRVPAAPVGRAAAPARAQRRLQRRVHQHARQRSSRALRAGRWPSSSSTC